MIKETFKAKFSEKRGEVVSMLTDENMTAKFKGEVWDTLINLRTGEREEIYQGHNLIVANASVLIAALIKRHTGYSGALYWEVGTGLSSWDSAIPDPASADSVLTTPLLRKSIATSDIIFVDNAGEESATPTNKIQISVTFSSSEANDALREFGIFGGDATDTLGSGLMINHKIHGVITKTSEMELRRVLRLTF